MRRTAARRTAKAHLAMVTAVAAMLAAGSLTMPADAAGAGSMQRVVVRTSSAVPSAAALAKESGTAVRAVRRIGPRLAVVAVRAASSGQAVRRLAASRHVVAASADRRTGLAGTRSPVSPGSRRYAAQWDLWDTDSTARAGGYGIDAPRAWARTTGSPDVVVAVLDTGITQHPDLTGASMAAGYDFVSDDAEVDSADGDGWDDDPSDPGDACAADGEASSWHGTFVAGQIVAQHRTSAGVAGAAPGVTLEPVRVLGACGGSESDAIAAIEWASGGVVPGVPANADPADVISMSLGGDRGGCTTALQTAIDDAASRGAVVVAAAGNDGAPVADVSPANCRGVISVAATTRAGALAGYSNRGTAALAPTISAPGGSTANPVLGDGWTSQGAADAGGNLPVLVPSIGTSMAAPRVAAAAALLLTLHPGLTPDQVRQRLVATATRFPVLGGCTTAVCGAGVLNMGSLLGASARFVKVTAPVITGQARVGRMLTARAGLWRSAPATVQYQWARDGRAITGGTARSYRLVAADAGHRITVRVLVQRPRTVAAAARSAARRATR